MPFVVAADLSNQPGTTPTEVVTVTGYAIPGDGGGGSFYWAANATGDADGGMVFGAWGHGRWLRLWSGLVNVRWFGATGDGHTDDTLSIQNAIDFCDKQQTGGTVFFPPGTYQVFAQPKENSQEKLTYKLLLKSKVNLVGCGTASVIRSDTNQELTSYTLYSDPHHVLQDVTIEALLIDGQESQQQKHTGIVQRTAIFVACSRALKILNCVFHDTADAIRLRHRCLGARVIANEIRCNQIDISRECILIDGAYDSILENNYIHDCPYATAVKMEGAEPSVYFSNVIRGNVFKTVGGGIYAKGGCIVSDNIIEAVANKAAIVGHHCHFTGNRILSSVAIGIVLGYGADVTEDVIIANNSIASVHLAGQGSMCDGIVAEVQTNGGTFEQQNLTIVNNLIDNRAVALPPPDKASCPIEEEGPCARVQQQQTAPCTSFNGIRLHSIGSRIIVNENQILAADYGIRMNVGRGHFTEHFCAAQNVITLNEKGVGLWLSSEDKEAPLLERVVVSGNLIGKAALSAANTTGIRIQGKPDGLIVTGNDFSAVDQAVDTLDGPPAHLILAENQSAI